MAVFLKRDDERLKTFYMSAKFKTDGKLES